MTPLGRWLRKGSDATPSSAPDPRQPPDATTARELSGRHLLLVPSTVTVHEVDALLRARVRGSDLLGQGEVVLGRHSRFTGPYELSMEEAVDAAVPMPWTVVYAVEAPVEREDPPLPGTDDRDGFAFAFPDGIPWRDEGRALHLLVSMARRVNGVVRTAGRHELICPDPQRAVDFAVHAPFWLQPEVLLTVVARELPTARLALEGEDWAGPSPEVYSGEAVAPFTADDPLTPEELEALHAHADLEDIRALTGEDVIDAYAIVAEVGPGGVDGAVEVLVHVAEGEEVAVLEEEWSFQPFVTYEVRWACPDPLDRESRLPGQAFLAARERVQPHVRAVTRAVVEATSGVVTDEDGFWFDRYSL